MDLADPLRWQAPGGNPLARGPLETRADLQRAVRDLYEPLAPYTSDSGARVRLGSFGASFGPIAAELEGFARPLYGLVPLAVGGGELDGWDRIVSGLEAGTDPSSPDYWGPVDRGRDQRMVEQAAIGVALAFCPEHVWEPLRPAAQQRLVTWLGGIFDHGLVPNNWQFFRLLVALGLERVGAPVPRGPVDDSRALIETFRRGEHWYVDGQRGNVDYYVPFACHTYGLIYAAANTLGLGDDAAAEAFRDRAAGFAGDFQTWFAPDGAAIPMGRSLTYRFAMASFWGALAWADVETSLSWGQVKGLALRHLRWWADKPIASRDGVLSVGFTYDNRVLAEGYNSPGSPYWCMKAFGALAAPATHPFWRADEEPAPELDGPVTLPDAGWVVTRDATHAVALIGRPATGSAPAQQSAAKYRKFAYSSVYGFSGDVPRLFGDVVTDSMLAFTDEDDVRRVRQDIAAAGVVDGMTWSTWHPWGDVRVDTVCWAIDGSSHGRLHHVRTRRKLEAVETGFALGSSPDDHSERGDATETDRGRAVLTTDHGTSAILGLDEGRARRKGAVEWLAVNANLLQPHTIVPLLKTTLRRGKHQLACIVFASPDVPVPAEPPTIPSAARTLLSDTIRR